MSGFENPGVLLAFGAGLLSFLSPCCLPLYPAYLSFLSGISTAGGGHQATRARVMTHAFIFVLGFSVIWVALGHTTSLLAEFFIGGKEWLSRLGGLLMVAMGLSLLGILRIPWLMREYRVQLSERPAGYFGSFVIGLAFAAGWTPCIGPILTTVLILAANQPGQGTLLLLVYSAGFAIPFLVLAYTMGSVRRLMRHARTIERVGGAIMVFMGLLLMTNRLSLILGRLVGLFGGFQGF